MDHAEEGFVEESMSDGDILHHFRKNVNDGCQLDSYSGRRQRGRRKAANIPWRVSKLYAFCPSNCPSMPHPSKHWVATEASVEVGKEHQDGVGRKMVGRWTLLGRILIVIESFVDQSLVAQTGGLVLGGFN